MSNHKHAYGWSGHILCRASEIDADKREAKASNVIAVKDEIFDRIVKDMEDCTTDPRIKVEQLGFLSVETVYFLATGTGFTEGWAYYGAPFKEAEARALEAGRGPFRDGVYLRAMKKIYGLELPPCRLMVGCSSEH